MIRRRLAAALLVAALAVTGCASGPTTTFPPLGSSPRPVGDATATIRADVIRALAAAGIQASDSERDFRPPEGPLLSAAPRSVLHADLTNDPDHGFIVVYALGSSDAAVAAATDQLAYLESNTGGKALLPPGTQFIVRPAGSTVVYFQWLPATSPDPRTAQIATAIGSVTSAVP